MIISAIAYCNVSGLFVLIIYVALMVGGCALITTLAIALLHRNVWIRLLHVVYGYHVSNFMIYPFW